MSLYNQFISVFGTCSDSIVGYGCCVIFYCFLIVLLFRIILDIFHLR